MALDGNIMAAAAAKHRARRDSRRLEQEQLTRRVYDRLPRVEQIDRDLRATTARVMLAALERDHPPEEVTVAAPTREDLPAHPWPFPLDAVVNLLDHPTQDHPLVNNQTTYYVCRNHTCQPPRNLYS